MEIRLSNEDQIKASKEYLEKKYAEVGFDHWEGDEMVFVVVR